MNNAPITITGPAYRARRIAEIEALLAECQIVRAAGFDSTSVEVLSGQLMKERDGLLAIGSYLTEIGLRRVEVERPRRVLSKTITAHDDVMLYVGDASREMLFTDAQGASVYAGRGLAFVPRAEWDAVAAKRIASTRERYIRDGNNAGPWGGERRSPQTFERDMLLVLDGEDRWSPRKIIERLGRSIHVRDWVSHEMGKDLDLRLTYRWWLEGEKVFDEYFVGMGQPQQQQAEAKKWWDATLATREPDEAAE